jgi:hypothetical protein
VDDNSIRAPSPIPKSDLQPPAVARSDRPGLLADAEARPDPDRWRRQTPRPPRGDPETRLSRDPRRCHPRTPSRCSQLPSGLLVPRGCGPGSSGGGRRSAARRRSDSTATFELEIVGRVCGWESAAPDAEEVSQSTHEVRGKAQRRLGRGDNEQEDTRRKKK